MKLKLKTLTAILLTCITLFACVFAVSGCKLTLSKTRERDWSEYFDLSDEKIAWDEVIDRDTVTGCIYVILKRQIKPVVLTVSDFQNSNVKSLQYINYYPDQRRSDDKEYLDNFRQDLYLNLKEVTREELSAVINDVERLDFVKGVGTIRAEDD